MDDRKTDIIELSLPANAAYVSAARLTASSVANRMDFDIDEMEDIKAAVSEACTYVINKAPAGFVRQFKVLFEPGDNILIVRIQVAEEKIDLSTDESDMSLLMIRALMDDFEITDLSGGGVQMSMAKRHNELFL